MTPVRLPQGAGQWAHLIHFLADPSIWHKIDLVRVRDRRAPGGWRYYAHLLTHQGGYQSAGTQARPADIPAERRAGIDAKVSNLSVASFPDQHPQRLVVAQITVTDDQQQAAVRVARRARTRQRALGADRDIVSAALAACVELADPEDPATARVNYKLAHALRAGLASQQEERAQSTGTSHRQRYAAGQARAGSHHPVAPAEQRNHHSAHPRRDRLSTRMSRDQPKTPAPQADRWPIDPLRVNS